MFLDSKTNERWSPQGHFYSNDRFHTGNRNHWNMNYRNCPSLLANAKRRHNPRVALSLVKLNTPRWLKQIPCVWLDYWDSNQDESETMTKLSVLALSDFVCCWLRRAHWHVTLKSAFSELRCENRSRAPRVFVHNFTITPKGTLEDLWRLRLLWP